MDENKNYVGRRKVFMEAFKDDMVLTKIIPETAAQLFLDEFGINVYDHAMIPIVFSIAWTQCLKFVRTQPVDEFAFDIAGVSLEYTTEYSESDKSRNIVPQLIHKRDMVFSKKQHQQVDGASHNDELLSKYNTWRSVNRTEINSKIESETFSIILSDYGFNLMVPATILPLIATIYTVGVQLARETKQTINMYNFFDIDVYDGDRVVLTPLAPIKQYLKDDSKVK